MTTQVRDLAMRGLLIESHGEQNIAFPQSESYGNQIELNIVSEFDIYGWWRDRREKSEGRSKVRQSFGQTNSGDQRSSNCCSLLMMTIRTDSEPGYVCFDMSINIKFYKNLATESVKHHICGSNFANIT